MYIFLGNGKRSGPPPDTGSRQKDRQYILRQLLLRDRIPTISDEVSLDDSPIIDDMDSILPDIQQQYERKQELNDIKEALSDLVGFINSICIYTSQKFQRTYVQYKYQYFI